jgi:hypothetical protein
MDYVKFVHRPLAARVARQALVGRNRAQRSPDRGRFTRAAPADHGIAFDVVRCPIANYFRGEESNDLCVASWCNLDYALAELTHEKLVHTKTLVRGDDRCDFRLN